MINWKFMIIEDNCFIREKFKNLMHWDEAGFELVGEAGNGETALKLIQEQRPDIILLDLDMPVMDGIQVMNELKKAVYPPKIIILSEDDNQDMVKEAVRLGACDSLLKHHVNLEDLLLVLERVVEGIVQERYFWGHMFKNRFRSMAIDSDELIFYREELARILNMYTPEEIGNEIDIVIKNLEEMKKQLMSYYEKDDTFVGGNESIGKAISYLEEHYQEQISLKDVADYVGMNPSYLSNMMKRVYGKGYSELLMDLRINQAKQLLRTTNHKIYLIGEMVGYRNAFYFNRIFKVRTGMTPIEYKKLILP